MKLELHIIQNFAPSLLNRDDTNALKTCQLGSVRRARVSSQCLNYHVREYVRKLVSNERMGYRSRMIARQVARRLDKTDGYPTDETLAVATTAMKLAGLSMEKDQLKALAFLPEVAMQHLVTFCQANRSKLAEIASDAPTDPPQPDGQAPAANGGGRRTKAPKGETGAKLPSSAQKELKDIFAGVHGALDVALMGRFFADDPAYSVDGARYQSHAVSTHRAAPEFDFYAGMSELADEEEQGAGMVDMTQFASPCYYRYAVVDTDQLVENLRRGTPAGFTAEELAGEALETYLEALILSMPSGKQHSYAAFNPPSFVLAVAREAHAFQLVNAFVEPARPDQYGDVIQNSIRKLDRFYGEMAKLGRAAEVKGAWAIVIGVDEPQNTPDEKGMLANLKDSTVGIETIDDLMKKAIAATGLPCGDREHVASTRG